MAWETRSRGTRYYTRSRRAGGRVVRQYVGAGLIGELLAEEDTEERLRPARQRAALDAARRRLAELDAPLSELCQLSDALAAGALLAAGYHRHDRGDWRKRRDEHEHDEHEAAGRAAPA